MLNIDTTAYPGGVNGTKVSPNTLAALAGVGTGAGFTPSPVTMAIGQGYGVANINLNAIFSPAEVSAIIMGVGPSSTPPASPVGWSGRYGGSPGQSFAQSSTANRQFE